MPSPADTDKQHGESRQGASRQGPPRFSLVARELDADTSVIAVTGELDLATAPDMRPMLDSALKAGRGIVVDLSETVFVDSTALSVLLDAARRLAGDGAESAPAKPGDAGAAPRLAIVCAQPNVLRIFEFSGLDGAFAIFSTLDDALAHARRQEACTG